MYSLSWTDLKGHRASGPVLCCHLLVKKWQCFFFFFKAPSCNSWASNLCASIPLWHYAHIATLKFRWPSFILFTKTHRDFCVDRASTFLHALKVPLKANPHPSRKPICLTSRRNESTQIGFEHTQAITHWLLVHLMGHSASEVQHLVYLRIYLSKCKKGKELNSYFTLLAKMPVQVTLISN